MDHKQMIEEALRAEGYPAQRWTEEDDRPVAHIGRFTVTEDHEMIFEGEEGEITVTVVGSGGYGNERVAFFFTPEGADCGNEVDLYSVVPV